MTDKDPGRPGGLSSDGSKPTVSTVPASIPDADSLGAGYDAWHAGEPFDEFQYPQWQEGWFVARDEANWRKLADACGATLHGFSGDHSASFLFGNQVHQISGGLLECLKRLTAQGMETRQGGDEGSVHDSPVGEANAPKTPPETPNGDKGWLSQT